MSKKSNPHDDIIIPSAGDSVKSLQDTIAGIARHKTLAEKIQYALADYYRRKEKWEKAHWLPQCGSWLQWRQYTDPNKTAVLTAANYCHHALCPICAWRRHAKYGAIFSRALEGMNNLYMVTMTVDNTPTITREQLQDIIKKSTAMLRSLKCSDYIANIEITYSDKKGFHPHVHAIVQQKYWSPWIISRNMAEWRRKWGQKMGGKHGYNIIRIDPINDTTSSVAEVTKYLCKPITKAENLQSVMDVLIPAVRRVRQIRTAGEMKKRILQAKIDTENDRWDEECELKKYDWYEVISQWINGQYVSFVPSRVGVEICGANTTRP